MIRTQALEAIRRERLVAIIRGLNTDQALAAVAALRMAGLGLVEVTCNSPAAMDTIRALRAAHGDALLIGAGTVLDVGAVEEARAAGAGFILSPDTDVEVIAATRAAGLVSVPGAFTPTEVRTALRAGADIVKIFPAGAVGPAYIKDLLGPLHDGRFMAVGGVNLENITGFFRAGAMSAGIGGALLDKNLLAAGDLAGLTALAGRFLNAATDCKGGPA